MAGRKPLPTHLKMVRGTLQKCRMNPDEPTPDPEIPDAPPHLSPEKRKIWRYRRKDKFLSLSTDLIIFLYY